MYLRRRLRKAGWEIQVAHYHPFVLFPLDVTNPNLIWRLDRYLDRNLPAFIRPLLAKSLVLRLRKYSPA
jgi:hypothetical protein